METKNRTERPSTGMERTDRPMRNDAGKFGGGRDSRDGRDNRDGGGRGRSSDNFEMDMMDGDEGMDLGGYDIEKDRKMFSKKKSCWFCAKKADPDWKDASTYSWLVNEFGKISPARVSGLCPKHQRAANTSIKRGRQIGLISYISNHVAR